MKTAVPHSNYLATSFKIKRLLLEILHLAEPLCSTTDHIFISRYFIFFSSHSNYFGTEHKSYIIILICYITLTFSYRTPNVYETNPT